MARTGIQKQVIRLQGSSRHCTVNTIIDCIPFLLPPLSERPAESWRISSILKMNIKNLPANHMQYGKPRHFRPNIAASHHFMKQHIAIFSKLDVSRKKHFCGVVRPQVGPQSILQPLGCANVDCQCCPGSGTLALEFRVFTATVADTAEEEGRDQGCRMPEASSSFIFYKMQSDKA